MMKNEHGKLMSCALQNTKISQIYIHIKTDLLKQFLEQEPNNNNNNKKNSRVQAWKVPGVTRHQQNKTKVCIALRSVSQCLDLDV